MSIEDDLHTSWGKHAIQDGIDAGELYTREQYEELESKRLSDCIDAVSRLVSDGMSLEKAIDLVAPADLREEVKKRFSSE